MRYLRHPWPDVVPFNQHINNRLKFGSAFESCLVGIVAISESEFRFAFSLDPSQQHAGTI
jgi:hypothetical protein